MNGKVATPTHVSDPQTDELNLDASFLEDARAAQAHDARAEIGRCPCLQPGGLMCDECRTAANRQMTLRDVQRRLASLNLADTRAPSLAEQRSVRRLDRRS